MNSITLNRGSDLDFMLVWPNGPGEDAEPMDLTGFTVSAYEAHPALSDHLSLQITNPAAGEISGRIEWSPDMPDGRVMGFIIRISDGTTTTALPRIWVLVQ